MGRTPRFDSISALGLDEWLQREASPKRGRAVLDVAVLVGGSASRRRRRGRRKRRLPRRKPQRSLAGGEGSGREEPAALAVDGGDIDAHMPAPLSLSTVWVLRVMVRRVPEMEAESVVVTDLTVSPEPLLEAVLLTVTVVTPGAGRSMALMAVSMADLTPWG